MTTENTRPVASMQSIVHRPWDFACQWYGEAEVERSIQRHLGVSHDGGDKMPTDVSTPEFAKWLTDQYRHAMRKGAELATREMQKRIDENESEDNEGWCGHCACQSCHDARAKVDCW